MNTNVIIALDERYKKKDNTYPIILRLSREERTLPIPTKYSVPSADWNDKKREVRNSYKGVTSVTRLNNLLQAQRTAARDIILKLEEEGRVDAMSLADIKKRIIEQSSSSSFITFTDEQVDDLREAKQFGTARWYECTLSVLKDFINGTDKHANNGNSKGNKKELYKGKALKFKDITYNFLKKFETKHYADGNSVNGLSSYMRAIRAIYNKAIKAGLADKESYPFDSYKIDGEETRKLALDWPLLQKILSHKLSPGDEYFDTRNYFVTSYMMHGMSFSDLAYLRKSDIVQGRIHYRRQKTSRLYDIKVTPALQEILSHYIEQSTDSRFVFPIIRRETALQQDGDVLYGRKLYNKQLKKLAKVCRIPEDLMETMTSKVVRHSFATRARLIGVPIDVIKEMLGHADLSTTQIYLKSLPTNVLDNYTDKMLEGSLL